MDHGGTSLVSNNLTIVSILGAFVSITDVQPILTLTGSIIAIVSGLISIYKKTKK